jgi:site-specific DNA recombinase
MENNTKRVVVYARVSSDRQDVDLSISAQLKALREYATRNGYSVFKEFVDEAESGRSTARPAFREMISLARMKQPPFTMILVWKLSRFARNREDSIIYKSLLRKQGIQVISINEPIEDTPTGRLMEGIIEVIDEFYSSNLAQDITRGLRENASRGFFNGSRPPFGYGRKKVKDGDKERNTLEPEPAQAAIVQRIFNEIANGKGLKEVAIRLNSDHISAPAGGKWGKQRLHKILTNETYTGRLIWGRNHRGKSILPPVIKDDAWPAIIEKTLFEKVQITLNSRAPKVTHPRVTSSKYLLSGLIKCQKCGAAYIGYGAKSGRFHYYVCGTTYSKGKDACPSQHLPKEKIEEFITNKIKGYVLSDGNLLKIIKISNDEMSTANQKYGDRVATIDSEIEQWQGRLERLYDFIETKAIEPERMAERIALLQDRIAELRQARIDMEEDRVYQRSKLLDPQKVLSYVVELRSFLDERGLAERKTFLRSFVEGIRVDDDKITLDYTLPFPPDNVKQEVISVLDIVPLAPPKVSMGRTELSLLVPLVSGKGSLYLMATLSPSISIRFTNDLMNDFLWVTSTSSNKLLRSWA